MKRLPKFSGKALTLLGILTTLVSISFFNLYRSLVASNSTLDIYDEGIAAGWNNWSWGASINFENPAPNNTGNKSIWVSLSPWGAVYFNSDNQIDTTSFSHLTFAIQSMAPDQRFQLLIYGGNNEHVKTLPIEQYGGLPTTDRYTVYNIPMHDIGAAHIKGVAVQDMEGVSQEPIFIDSVRLVSKHETLTEPKFQEARIGSQEASKLTESSLGGGTYTVSKGQIFQNGNRILLRGVNWFGFETETRVPHGLWARNYKDMILQMKSLGFNAVRIPICPATLRGEGVSSIDYSQNVDLQGLTSLQVLDRVLGEINNQQMYILLDHHRPDCEKISELWYHGAYSEESWISDLKFMADRYKNLPYLMGIDLKNEPHGAATWGTGNAATDWNTAAEKAGRAVLTSNPNVLIFVEGIGENPVCSSTIGHGWGGNLEPQKCFPISTNYIPENKLVLSPHVYGPDAYFHTYFGVKEFPNNMPAIWDTHFGFLVNEGFTLVPGEWGGRYATGGGHVEDKAFQDKLTQYFTSKGICNSFFWSFNPNSGDTGGVLQDDWQTVWNSKMEMIRNYHNSCR